VRIAVIAPPWVAVPPPTYGGIEAVLDTLARGLNTVGHDVLLYTTGDSTCPVPKAWTYEHAPGVGVGGVATEVRHVIDAYDAIGGADIVHDHTLIGPMFAERWRLPVVTTNHGPFAGDLSALYRVVGPRVPVIAISHHQASVAGGIPVAAVIHHGIDPAMFPFGDGNGGYALFLGRMSPDKGVHTAVHVARRVGIPLRIAAKVRERAEYDYFNDEVKPLLGGNVEFLGEVGGEAKLDLLGRAACLLNPIAWPEPFGMVMIEALACGTPVIATPCGAAPEIVDDGVTGFLRHDEDALAVTIAKVPDLDRRACRQAAEARFSTTRMVHDHLRLYQRVLDARPRQTGAAAA
jgi:glycosyltransferase involved in cell wall biosynthesis